MRGNPITEEELEYIAYFYFREPIKQIALGLGRPASTIQHVIKRMIKNDELDFYKECYEVRYERYGVKSC